MMTIEITKETLGMLYTFLGCLALISGMLCLGFCKLKLRLDLQDKRLKGVLRNEYKSTPFFENNRHSEVLYVQDQITEDFEALNEDVKSLIRQINKRDTTGVKHET